MFPARAGATRLAAAAPSSPSTGPFKNCLRELDMTVTLLEVPSALRTGRRQSRRIAADRAVRAAPPGRRHRVALRSTRLPIAPRRRRSLAIV